VQEHIAYRVWPLASGWEMPKEAAAGSSQGGLVYLKYTFKYRNQFDEPNDDWLDAIEATSDEMLGAYSKAEDDAMMTAFGGRSKKRLSRVFDVIGFMYPNYCYHVRKQGKKRKTATSASSSTPKSKNIKVLTHRPRCIETAEVPKLIEPSHSTPAEAKPSLAEKSKLKEVTATEGFECTAGDRIAEGNEGSCNNSKEEENGHRARCCYGNCKGINSWLCRSA
jgi:hypothetical protein